MNKCWPSSLTHICIIKPPCVNYPSKQNFSEISNYILPGIINYTIHSYMILYGVSYDLPGRDIGNKQKQIQVCPLHKLASFVLMCSISTNMMFSIFISFATEYKYLMIYQSEFTRPMTPLQCVFVCGTTDTMQGTYNHRHTSRKHFTNKRCVIDFFRHTQFISVEFIVYYQ